MLEKMDPAAELDALADALIEHSAPEDANFGEIVQLATAELLRRFKEEPENLPGTFVIKLVLDGLKAIRDKDVPVEKVEEGLTILDSLDAVPREHALNVLDREIGRRREELALFESRRKELE